LVSARLLDVLIEEKVRERKTLWQKSELNQNE